MIKESVFERRRLLVDSLYKEPVSNLNALETKVGVGHQFGYVLRRSSFIKEEEGKWALKHRLTDQELKSLMHEEKKYATKINTKYQKRILKNADNKEDDLKKAIELLKSKGYRILAPITEYK